MTGAGSGVGRAAAHALMKAGFTCILTGRKRDNLEETLAGGDGKAVVMPADVSKETEVDGLFAGIEEQFSRLDVLFNNAGINIPAATIDEIDPAGFRKVIDVNLTGSFLCARAAFILMRRQKPMGGRIINNGSISAYAPRPGSVPYTTSKHAITGLTRTIALDGRPYDIACGQIDIGNAATDMAKRLGDGALQPRGDIMPEPLMDVSIVGDAVVHMASLPLSANILFMNVMATKMPFVGRG
ncbi:MAG: SDR family oxidoreductase [Flavobacteriaceae bacterium]